MNLTATMNIVLTELRYAPYWQIQDNDAKELPRLAITVALPICCNLKQSNCEILPSFLQWKTLMHNDAEVDSFSSDLSSVTFCDGEIVPLTVLDISYPNSNGYWQCIDDITAAQRHWFNDISNPPSYGVSTYYWCD